MLGKRSDQWGLFEADNLYLDFVGRQSFYGFLASQRGQLFRDEEFVSLYCANNGRNSVPPSLLANALLLQTHDRISDEEAKERADFDLRWKVALGIGIQDRPFAKSTLQVFRAQLILHEKVMAVFQKSLTFARQTGYLKNRKIKAVLDTSNILGRGAVKDTYNLLADGIVKLIRVLASLDGTKPEDWAQTHELSRYYGNSENRLWVIYTDSRFKNPAEIAHLPNLKSHLDQFNRVITSGNHPYGLHRARDEKFFTGEKIVSLRKCAEPCFTYTDFPCYVSQTFNIIKTDRVNLLYLTALLNSRLVRFWLKHRGKMQGQNFQVDKEPLLAIPLCVPDKTEQERLAKITKRIIECKQKMAGVTTDSAQMQLQRSFEQFEAQLDDAIETLYGLDEADRLLVAKA